MLLLGQVAPLFYPEVVALANDLDKYGDYFLVRYFICVGVCVCQRKSTVDSTLYYTATALLLTRVQY